MSDVHSDVGSYVADALTEDERMQFEMHLTECENCRREVAEFSETAAELAALSATAPPPELRRSVMWAIAGVRPLPPEEPVSELTSVVEADELALRRQRRIDRVLKLAVAAALVVALALGGWVYALTVQQEALVAQQQSQQATEQEETELLSAPDAKMYNVEVNGDSASFVVSKQLNRAMFVGAELADPGAGRAYQLWTITPDQHPIPDGVISGGGSVRQWFSEPVRDAAAVAITNEPQDGSTEPTLPILALAPLT